MSAPPALFPQWSAPATSAEVSSNDEGAFGQHLTPLASSAHGYNTSKYLSQARDARERIVQYYSGLDDRIVSSNYSFQGPYQPVRTIFVLGFPPDVKERELQNLLRWWPGYEASQMNFKGDQPMGFALFTTPAMAMAARDALQNLVFDSETNSVLRSEMAKKNLFVRRGGTTEPLSSYDSNKRMRTSGDDSIQQYATQAVFIPPVPSWGPQSYIAPTPPYDPYGGYAVTQVPPLAPAGYAPVQNTKDNPPCNTLFIGNLGESASEVELRGIFSGQPGFRQMKVLRQGKSTVCFIEFMDVNTAMAVHQHLQGAVLTSSDRGGMRIQYSKNPYGRKKDGGSQQPDAAPGLSTPVAPELNGSSALPVVPLPPTPLAVPEQPVT